MSKKSAPHLPGYYFDVEKNRYFKLIPGQEHTNPLTGKRLHDATNSRSKSFEKSYNVHNKSKVKSKNICFLTSHQQVSSHRYKSCVLSSLFNQMLEKENILKSPSFYEYFDSNISRFLTTKNKDKILLQSGDLTLTQVDDVDSNDNVLTMAIRYHFPYDQGSSFTDFAFAYSPFTEEAIVAAIVPPHGGSSFVVWGPDHQRCIHRKSRKEFVGVCKWLNNYMVYSVDSNFVLVYDCDCHFTSRSYNAGAALVKTNTAKNNFVSAVECTESVIYVGHRNGTVFGYDRRTLDKTSSAIYTDVGNVCDMHALSNECQIVTRYSSTVDCIYLWDLRFLKKPVLNYGSFQNSKNIGCRGMHKYCFLDSLSNVMSCYHIDEVLRLWDITTGCILAESNELCGGIYSENWSINNNKSGIVGLKDGKIVWLPIRNEN